MREVQKVSCINGAGFQMSFRVAADGPDNDSDHTRVFENPNYQTVNAKGLSLAEGTEVWPHISVHGGPDRTGPRVRYMPNGQVAVYSITGTTDVSDVDLIGGTA